MNDFKKVYKLFIFIVFLYILLFFFYSKFMFINYVYKSFSFSLFRFFGKYQTIDSQKVDLLIEKNKKLKSEIAALKEENKRLKNILQIKQSLSFNVKKAVLCEVINTNFTSFQKNIIISSGKKAGIKNGDIVISSKGLVGRVKYVFDNYAIIRTIIDASSIIPAMIQKNRQKGFIYGISSYSHLKFVSQSRINGEKGDIIITSGYGGIFPRGIAIGEIEKIVIDKYGLPEEAIVKPFVEFDKLEYVMVLSKDE